MYQGRIGRGLGRAGLALALAASLGVANRCQGAGLLIADGGFGGVLELHEHSVDVTINNGIAVTRVVQVFHNTENRQVEALYTFPVPKGASVANFSMWINGKEMIGEVVEKQRAREIYNSYKQRRRDPGLLEQVDYKTFEMRIFPIAPQADQRIEITYYQELDVDHDTARYLYPLATVTREGLRSEVKGKFAINIDILSAIPLKSLDSPSHAQDFVIARHAEDYMQASLETPEGSLARDVVLALDMRRPRTGIDVITSTPEDEDGYFQLTMTAGEDLAALDVGMDYVFVLDASGSMSNDRKMIISRDAITAFIAALGPEDRFEVMTFNVQPQTLFNSMRGVDTGSRSAATAFLDSRQGRGGTVLKPALDTALRYTDPDRPLNIVILSDGMTEQRERSTLLETTARLGGGVRVFCIGVGNEVNRPLLEQLAEDSGGLAAFISRGDDFKRQAQAFRRKLTRPVMSDITLELGGLDAYDIVPARIPNLYHGSPVRVYGRFKGAGQSTVTIKGAVMGKEVTQSAALTFAERAQGNPEIERMWASHRIDQLQKVADRSNSRDSVVDEIIRLGEGYSIVTEYTSFLVLENDGEYKRWKIDRRNLRRMTRDRAAHERTRKHLANIRDKAAAQIGPTPSAPPESDITVAAARPRQQAPQAQVPRPRSTGTGVDFGLGTGPVGPLFIALAALLARRNTKKKAA